jgi:ABC-type sugar transport system permease subunit
LTLAVVAAAAFFGMIAMARLLRDGLVPLATLVGGIVVFFALVYARRKFSPLKWLAVGVALVAVFTVYPIVYTAYLSFTNMGGGHLVTKAQAEQRLMAKTYKPAEAASYSWAAFASAGGYAVWLQDGAGTAFLAKPGRPLERYDAQRPWNGALDELGVPTAVPGYTRLLKKDVVPLIGALGALEFGEAPDIVKIVSLGEATRLAAQYSYDQGADAFTDVQTGKAYAAAEGAYTAADGETLIPGYMATIGFRNYARFLGNEGYRRPMLAMFVWNLAFAFGTVLFSFALGLVIALLFDDLPGKGIIRSVLIIPYPIPVLVSIMVWRGLMNERMGLFTKLIETVFHATPRFFTETAWSQAAVILINVYLSYPYFYIIAAGALRSIPGDIIEAATIDGAGAWTRFRSIVLPLLLRILAPLLIASFSFNFNNFTLIWTFNAGLPAMADTIVPMGYTDLLISFIYRLGFSTANAADYGFAAALTVILFAFVGLMVFFQTRSTKSFKETA